MADPNFTDLRIEPSGPLGGYVDAPPSKNYTTRMVLAAAMAEGRSEIVHPADNDDAKALIKCCRALGAQIALTPEGLRIDGVGGRPRNPGVLDPENAGAVLRLLLGVGCLVDGDIRFETKFQDSLGRRPNRELLEALKLAGAEIVQSGPDGELPIVIRGGVSRLRAGEVSIDGRRSSQFLSSLLFLGSLLDHPLRISLLGQNGEAPLVSRPLIDQTIEVLNRFGSQIEVAPSGTAWRTTGGGLRAGKHNVPGDWPSAAALMAAVAVAGGMVSIRGLQADAQGERRIGDALQSMGCQITRPEPGHLFFHSKGELEAIEFNGDLATDGVLALEAAACLAQGTTRITGIGNLSIKESDRIRAPLAELAKLGIPGRCGPDWIEIEGRPGGFEGGIDVECHGDHRIAQMLAIVATRCSKGLTLRGASCVSKSYPAFFEDMKRLGVHIVDPARS